jgi:hypothetical protein
MKQKTLVSIFISFLFIGNIIGQKSNLPGKLPWVNGNLPANSINYNYKVAQGDGSSLSDSQNQAVENLIFQLGSEQGFSVSSETMVKTQSLIKNNKEEYSMDFQDKTVINQDKFKAVFTKVDEYFEETEDLNGNQIYRTWQLYVTGSSANESIPKINYTNKYGMNDAGFRSLIVPGWGQFYKKKRGKGMMFLIGTVGSLGGFLYANNEHSNNMNRSRETNDLALKKQFVEKAGDFTTIKNITLGAAAALWIWNVIDATSTEGATKYAQNKPIKFNIVSDVNSSLALNLKYKF